MEDPCVDCEIRKEDIEEGFKVAWCWCPVFAKYNKKIKQKRQAHGRLRQGDRVETA